MRIFLQQRLHWPPVLYRVAFSVLPFLYVYIHFYACAFVLIRFAALRATDVRGLEPSLGINRSRDCCRYYDPYPYHSPALRTLFAFKIQVRTECATYQTTKLCSMNRKAITCQYGAGP
jgi:hypothetical protein